MSYLVLARKLRPQTFEQVVGQETIVRTLKNALKKNRVAHAMIFSGVRGVGKTTLARLMAKAINCEQREDPPCNQCFSCKKITTGASVDLHEIDGASNRGIQEIRELKENIRFQPVLSPYKIIIIDEVHMLTNEAFNALLKTLEEPPEHVYFMFATTEIHKVPVTILSRCQRYELKRVSSADLTAFFRKIAEDENVEISDIAIAMITREASGSVRDGLSLLDQVMSFGGEKISDADVTEVLGLVSSQVYADIAVAVLENNLAACLKTLNDSYRQGISLKRFSVDLLAYFRSLIVTKIGAGSAELLDIPDQEKEVLRNLVAQYSSETLVKNFHVLMKGVQELQYASQPKLVLEVTFMKMIALGDVVNAATLLERLAVFSLSGGGGEPDSFSGVAKEVVVPDLKPDNGDKTETSSTERIEDDVSPPPRTAKLVPESEILQDVGEPEVAPKPEATFASQYKGKDVRKHWEGFIAHVKDRKPWMSHALSLCQSAKESDGKLVLKYDTASECKIVQDSDNIKLLNEFALDFFQKELKINIVVKSGKLLEGDEIEQDIPQQERRALGSDPLVLMTTEVLGGQVSGIRTGPRSR